MHWDVVFVASGTVLLLHHDVSRMTISVVYKHCFTSTLAFVAAPDVSVGQL